MEATVGPFGRSFSREHTRRVFAQASVRVHAARVRVSAGQVFLHQEAQQFAPVREVGRRDLWNLLVAQRLPVVVARDLAAAHRVAVMLRADAGFARRPLTQLLERFRRQVADGFLVALSQCEEAPVIIVCQGLGRVGVKLGRQRRILQQFERFINVLRATRDLRLLLHARV